jgi:hypothetical protein
MALNYFLADSKTDTCPGIFLCGVETLEEDKDTLKVLRINSNTVVMY